MKSSFACMLPLRLQSNLADDEIAWKTMAGRSVGAHLYRRGQRMLQRRFGSYHDVDALSSGLWPTEDIADTIWTCYFPPFWLRDISCSVVTTRMPDYVIAVGLIEESVIRPTLDESSDAALISFLMHEHRDIVFPLFSDKTVAGVFLEKLDDFLEQQKSWLAAVAVQFPEVS